MNNRIKLGTAFAVIVLLMVLAWQLGWMGASDQKDPPPPANLQVVIDDVVDGSSIGGMPDTQATTPPPVSTAPPIPVPSSVPATASASPFDGWIPKETSSACDIL